MKGEKKKKLLQDKDFCDYIKRLHIEKELGPTRIAEETDRCSYNVIREMLIELNCYKPKKTGRGNLLCQEAVKYARNLYREGLPWAKICELSGLNFDSARNYITAEDREERRDSDWKVHRWGLPFQTKNELDKMLARKKAAWIGEEA